MKTSVLGKIAPAPLPDDAVKMSIDSAGMDLLMENLTNLYESPYSAVLREYMSNAVDAHKAAQTPPDYPINMTLAANKLVIQDFGVGMSKDDMINIYARYGASTKRDTNTQIGGFGLGAKSALAITNRFEVTSVKDGWETVAYIEKTPERAATLFFVSHTPTDNPSGTTVKIPFERQNLDSLISEAQRRIRCFPDDIFRLNGKPQFDNVHSIPWFTVKDGLNPVGYVRLRTDRTKTNNRNYSQVPFEVSVGGVYYNLEKFNRYEEPVIDEKGNTRTEFNRFGLLFQDFKTWVGTFVSQEMPLPILSIPVGSVDLTPSRDSFISTDRTYEAFKQTIQAFKNGLDDSFKQTLLTLPAEQGQYVAALNPLLVKAGRVRNFTLNGGTSYPYSIKLQHSIITAGEHKAPRVDHGQDDLRLNYLAEREFLTRNLVYSRSAYAKSTIQNGKTVFLKVPSLGAMYEKSPLEKKINRMVRDYAMGTFGNEAIELYVIDETVDVDALPEPWTALVDNITDLDNFTKVAKEALRVKMSKAQAGATKNKLTQSVYDIDADQIMTMKEVDLLTSGKSIYYISSKDQHVPHGSRKAVDLAYSLYAAVYVSDAPEKVVVSEYVREVYNHVVPDSYIVIIPSTKSAPAYAKRAPEASPFIEKALEFTKETVKTKADKELFYDIVMLLRNNDQRSLVELVREHLGPDYALEDPVLSAIQHGEDVYYAAAALYPFINTAESRLKQKDPKDANAFSPYSTVVLTYWKKLAKEVSKGRVDVSDRYTVLVGSALFLEKIPPYGRDGHPYAGREYRAFGGEIFKEPARVKLAFATLNALYRGSQG